MNSGKIDKAIGSFQQIYDTSLNTKRVNVFQAKGKWESKAACRWIASSCAITVALDAKSYVAE